MDDFEVNMQIPNRNSFVFKIIAVLLAIAIAIIGVYMYLNNGHEPDNSEQNSGLLETPQFEVADQTALSELYENVVNSVVTVKTQSMSSSFPFGSSSGGMGSGFIVTEAGHIVTNYHVISSASVITVQLYNGHQYNATVIDYDSKKDIAVIKITPDEELSVAYIADSTLSRTGDWVFAIGTPYAEQLYGTVTRGIISFSDRILSDNGVKYLQIDAAINSGNSGGPLFNMKGEVIGINTSKITLTDVENIGFSIASETFKPIVESILSTPATIKLGIGISGVSVSSVTSNTTLPNGVIVMQVTTGAPADLAGMQPYDIITEFDGVKVSDVQDITDIISKHSEGDTVLVKVVRDSANNVIELQLTLKNVEFYG